MLGKNRKISFENFVVVALLMLGAAGCAGSNGAPALIGAYPAEDHDESHPHFSDVQQIVYAAVLEMQVNSVPRTVEKITRLAHDHGGYVEYANTWHEGRTEYATVEVSVPVRGYDALYARISRLGTLERESVRGELEDISWRDQDDWRVTTITAHLSERSGWLSGRTGSTHTASTFWKAFEVTATLFRFLFDAAIWVLVVAGPFVLLGWGGRQLWRRARLITKQTSEEESK